MTCGAVSQTLEGQTTKLSCKYDKDSRTITLYLPSNYDTPTVLSTVSGWAHGSDITTIDGAKIYANSIILANVSGDLDDVADGTTYAKTLAAALSSGSVLLSQAVGNLDNISDGSTYGRVNVTSISAGNILIVQCSGDLDDISNGTTYGKVNLTSISAGNILLAQCSGDLDDVSDGSGYGKVALTSITAGKIIVAGLDSGVTARMFTDGTTQTNIEAWRHASDVTLIDGGDIYAGSVTATQITVTNLAAINADCGAITAGTLSSSDWAAAAGVRLDLANKWLKMGGSNVTAAGAAAGAFLGLDTSYKFYVGDGSNEYLKFDATNVEISLSKANALTIKSGGDIKVEAGGDIILVGSDSDPGLCIFDGTSYDVNIGAIKADGSEFGIWPETDDVTILRIGAGTGGILGGGTAKEWSNIYIYSDGEIVLMADSEVQISGAELKTLDVSPSGSGTQYCGSTSSVWSDVATITVTMFETTTPTAVTNFGKLYTKNDNKLYFQDGAGVEKTVAFV